MALNISNYCANVQANALIATNYLNLGTLTIYSGTQPLNADTALSGNTALATFTLPATVGTNLNGVITFNAITNVTAGASGTATFFRITNGANTLGDGTVNTSGADLNLVTTAISSGATISISAFSWTIVAH